MTDLQAAWLAGLLEGEGSFIMANNRVGGKVYRYPGVFVNMTDFDVIEKVAALFGTKIYKMPQYGQKSRLQQWRALAMCARAANIMLRVRPFMGARRGKRIDEILAEYELRTPTAVRRRQSCQAAALHRHRRADGTFLPQRHVGESNGNAGITEAQALHVLYLKAAGVSQADISRQTGIGRDNVWRIVHRKNWKHLKAPALVDGSE